MRSRFASNRDTTFGSRGSPAMALPLPQPHGRRTRKAIDGDLAAAHPNLQRVRLPPARVIGPVAVSQEVDALVGGADPAPVCFGLLTQVGAVDQDVREGEQLVGVRLAAATDFFQ